MSCRAPFFSHPETTLPVTSGLVRDAQHVLSSVADSSRTILSSAMSSDGSGRQGCGSIYARLFRTADGSCNNGANRGQSLQPLARLLPAQYDDEDTRGVVDCCGPDRGPPLGNESSECFPILFSPGDPDFRGYLLRTTEDEFPPDNGIDDCIKRDAEDICFLAGDDRVNEQPGLTLLHTVFVRYHNQLARSLRRYRPFSSDEFIFEQARAIVGAVMQKILYSDWLPIVLGPSIRRNYKLDIWNRPSKHDPNQDPRIFTSFSTAVFRVVMDCAVLCCDVM
ncbi:hypothetical protein ACOMHN_028981 [Nucella lapillus]